MADELFPGHRKIITVDCRELLPPEPMIRVLEAVEKMSTSEAILMQHRMKPLLIFSKLKERGLKSRLKEFEDGSIELLIWKE